MLVEVNAALGYFELGLYEDALEELEELPPERQVSAEVLHLKSAIFMQMKKWTHLWETSKILVRFQPELAQHWIWHAYATRRVLNIEEAERILRAGLEKHPEAPMIHFNLACYCAQTGQLPAAREFLAEAIRIAPESRAMALDDPDLEPLW